MSTPPDWRVLLRAFGDAGEWVLDCAADTAREFPAEVAVVERVRRFVRAQRAGRPAYVRIDDLLFTFGLVLVSVERDLGPLSTLPPSFAVAPFEIRAAA